MKWGLSGVILLSLIFAIVGCKTQQPNTQTPNTTSHHQLPPWTAVPQVPAAKAASRASVDIGAKAANGAKIATKATLANGATIADDSLGCTIAHASPEYYILVLHIDALRATGVLNSANDCHNAVNAGGSAFKQIVGDNPVSGLTQDMASCACDDEFSGDVRFHRLTSYPGPQQVIPFGSVLICNSQVYPPEVASNLPRMNSDLVCPLALASDSIVRSSSEVTRMRSIAALVLPLGRGGRPALGFFGCFKAFILLHNGCSHGVHR
jgi:hypothetical protein